MGHTSSFQLIWQNQNPPCISAGHLVLFKYFSFSRDLLNRVARTLVECCESVSQGVIHETHDQLIYTSANPLHLISCRSVGVRHTLQFRASFLCHGLHKPVWAVRMSFVIHNGLGWLFVLGWRGSRLCTLCFTAGFPGTGTKRRLELVSPLQSHKYQAVWETGLVLETLQHLGLPFFLAAGHVGGGAELSLSGVNAEGLCTVCSCPGGHLTYLGGR